MFSDGQWLTHTCLVLVGVWVHEHAKHAACYSSFDKQSSDAQPGLGIQPLRSHASMHAPWVWRFARQDTLLTVAWMMSGSQQQEQTHVTQVF